MHTDYTDHTTTTTNATAGVTGTPTTRPAGRRPAPRTPGSGAPIAAALERSRARRGEAERQLRALRGNPQAAPLAELDSLLAYELQLEARLAEVLDRSALAVAG